MNKLIRFGLLAVSATGVTACTSLLGGFDFDGATGGSGTGGGTSTSTDGIHEPCSPGVSCPGAESECVALADYTAKTQFTLRMADLTLTAPPSLSASIFSNILTGSVTINLPECNFHGSGTFSWLLQFDTLTGKLKAGGAKPAKAPADGYSFINETIAGFPVAPFEINAPIKDGKFAMATGADLTLPVYFDIKATGVLLLPIHAVKLSGTISADNNCIGKYNAKDLQPAANCAATLDTPAYVGADGKANSDGTLEGFITLEQADTVQIDVLKQSLCFILSGESNPSGGGTLKKCQRDLRGKIVFQGDWCAATNDATCKDAVRLVASFSASGVKAN